MEKSNKELTVEIVLAMMQIAPGRFKGDLNSPMDNTNLLKLIEDVYTKLQSLKEDADCKPQLD